MTFNTQDGVVYCTVSVMSTLLPQVKAVHYNGTSIGNVQLYLFTGERWSARLVQNLTADINGVATFSLPTNTFSGDVILSVSTAQL